MASKYVIQPVNETFRVVTTNQGNALPTRASILAGKRPGEGLSMQDRRDLASQLQQLFAGKDIGNVDLSAQAGLLLSGQPAPVLDALLARFTPVTGADRGINEYDMGGDGGGGGGGLSNGPNLGELWPNYNGTGEGQNPNVEEQYATWRDEARENAKAAGTWDGVNPATDPGLDMGAFRQHLIDIDAPDPGPPAQPAPSTGGNTPSTGTGGSTGGGAGAGAGGNAGGGTGGGGGTTGGGAAGGGTPFTGRPLDRIFTGGGTPDFSQMTDTEKQHYLPYGKSPGLANRNFLRAFGFNPDLGNPFTDTLDESLGPLSKLTEQQLMAGDEGGANESDIANAVARQISQGSTNPFNGDSGRAFLERLSGMQRTGGSTLNQKALVNQIKDPETAYELAFGALGSNLSPTLRNSAALRKRVFGSMYENYYNASPTSPTAPNRTFLDYILNKGAA